MVNQLETMPAASISLIDKIKEIEKLDTGIHSKQNLLCSYALIRQYNIEKGQTPHSRTHNLFSTCVKLPYKPKSFKDFILYSAAQAQQSMCCRICYRLFLNHWTHPFLITKTFRSLSRQSCQLKFYWENKCNRTTGDVYSFSSFPHLEKFHL